MKLTESKTVYRGIIVDVKIDKIAMPDGTVLRREVVVQRDAAAILPVLDNGDILLVRQYRHPVGGMALEIPAGFLEDGETPLECASREMEEEIGKFAKSVQFLFAVHGIIGISTHKTDIFLAKDFVESKQKLDEDEFLTIESYTLQDCLKMIKSGEITSATTVAALLAYAGNLLI